MPKMPKTKNIKGVISAISDSFSRKAASISPTVGGPAQRKTNLIAANRGLGQHFLNNPTVIHAMIQKAGLQPTDVCLEIGPGTGNITIPLLDKCSKVVALERDPRMISELSKHCSNEVNGKKLQIIQGDAVTTKFPFFDVCIANLPFQISSPIVFKLLQHRPMFREAVLMFQEEFALRLTAKPGEKSYCRLSVNAQLLAKIDQLFKVDKSNFHPPPKVESRVVRIVIKQPPPPVNFVEWDGMVRLLFKRKNKTLRAVLMTRSTIQLLESNRQTHLALLNKTTKSNNNDNNDMQAKDENNKKSVKELIEEITQRPKWKGQRASKLDLDDFLQLLTEFHDVGICFK